MKKIQKAVLVICLQKERFIKWKNSKNARSTKVSKKLLKEPYQIAKLIQDLGFYDGDISELVSTIKLDN